MGFHTLSGKRGEMRKRKKLAMGCMSELCRDMKNYYYVTTVEYYVIISQFKLLDFYCTMLIGLDTSQQTKTQMNA